MAIDQSSQNFHFYNYIYPYPSWCNRTRLIAALTPIRPVLYLHVSRIRTRFQRQILPVFTIFIYFYERCFGWQVVVSIGHGLHHSLLCPDSGDSYTTDSATIFYFFHFPQYSYKNIFNGCFLKKFFLRGQTIFFCKIHPFFRENGLFWT